MIFEAILSSKRHPEYGVATIPFPIPAGQYDHTIELLEAMDIGSATIQDCRIDEISSNYPIFNRLTAQIVNVDELDYLAKRLDGFCKDECAQFQAVASKLCLSDIKDLINLTFCCQQATVITNFSDLERIGKSHSLTINGGSMPMEEFDQVDGLAVALDLIQGGAGVVTPYGVVYDNGMKLEQIYTGASFPQYQYDDPLLTLGVPIQPEIGGPVETAWLYLPVPEEQISRTLRRIGIVNSDAAYYIEDSTLLPGIFAVIERPDDAILELNRMCQVISSLDEAGLEKLEAVVLMAQPEDAGEIRQLAENLDQFDFVPGVESPERNSLITKLGYVAYHGSLTLDELMRDDPAEQHQRELEMGGDGVMILRLSCQSLGIDLRLPASDADVKRTLSTLRDGLEKNAPVRISGVCGNAYSLHGYIRHADLENEGDLQKLNRLAELFDSIAVEQQHILSGALDAESINGLDDVLRVASSLDQYEFIEGVTSDKELGGWLVEHGLAGVDFPQEVRPYLDYAGIGAEYYANHGGAYAPNGYVKRRESIPEHTSENKSRLSLALRSGHRTCRLDFPVSETELEAARQVLGVAELTDDRIDSIMIGYSWSSLLPLDDITLEDFDVLAQYVQQMGDSELKLFGAALEAEEPETFSDAVCIAENLDDYELVDSNEEAYGREALRYAGAGDEILDMLDGFTDFDALGRFEMEQDGVRETSFGQVKRFSVPFPQQNMGQTMC